MDYRSVDYLTTLLKVHRLYYVELIRKMDCEFVAAWNQASLADLRLFLCI